MVLVGGAPLWLADAGIGILFGGWALYALLTIVFNFLEGLEAGKRNRGP